MNGFGLFDSDESRQSLAPLGEQVHVRLLPDRRLEITGNTVGNYEKDGRTYRSSKKFCRTVSLPESVDVEPLTSLMDSKGELTIERPQNQLTIADRPERVVEVVVEGQGPKVQEIV